MESSFLTAVLLPLSLFIIMVGMGLSLAIADFRRVLLYPKAMLTGLVNQLIILPVIGFAFAHLFGLPPLLAVGLMVLAASPGGVTSNLITHLAHGDTALSISMTAVSSLVTVISLPIIVSLSLEHFLDQSQAIQLPVIQTIGQILAITAVPVAMGMFIRHRNQAFAQRMDRPVRIFSTIVFIAIMVAAILKERDILIDAFQSVGLSTLCLNLAMMVLGYASSVLLRLDRRQAIAISIETGLQNGTLALVVTSSILMQPEMSITPAVYSLVMFMTAGLLVFWLHQQAKRSKQ